MPPAPTVQEDTLPRNLGLWSAAAVLIGTTIGSGIFLMPSVVAKSVGSPLPMLGLWVVAGIVTLTGALSIAEMAAAFPRSGGIFAYILEAYGRLPAFVYGWAELTVIRAAAMGGIATVFARYLRELVVYPKEDERFVAAAVILAIAMLNYVGISYAAVLMNFTTVLKYGALLGLTFFAFGAGQGDFGHFTLVAPGSMITGSVMLTALVRIMWAYDGWSNLSFVGGEVKDPQRNLPKALILGVSAIMLIYLLVNAAYVYLLSTEEIAGADRVAALAVSRIPMFGAAGASIMAAIVMLSGFGSVNGTLMTGPRIFFAMSEQRLFFPIIARVSPRFKTPSAAIWLAAGLGVAYVLQNTFAQLAERFVLGTWPFYAMSVAAVFTLRKQRPDMPRPYRTWGYPVTPALFLLASLGMVVNAIITNPKDNGFTFGVILTGIPAYYVWKWWEGRQGPT